MEIALWLQSVAVVDRQATFTDTSIRISSIMIAVCLQSVVVMTHWSVDLAVCQQLHWSDMYIQRHTGRSTYIRTHTHTNPNRYAHLLKMMVMLDEKTAITLMRRRITLTRRTRELTRRESL